MAMYDERLRQWPVPFETYLVPGRYGKWGRSVLTTPVAAQCYPLEAVTCAFREFRKRPHSDSRRLLLVRGDSLVAAFGS
jgi:hypothetical protein